MQYKEEIIDDSSPSVGEAESVNGAASEFQLGEYFLRKEDFVKALQHYEWSARAGNASALQVLAAYYNNKEKNSLKAIEYLLKLPDNDYEYNRFLDEIIKKNIADEEFRTAFLASISKEADNGTLGAIFFLGKCYLEGIGLEKNEKRGLELLNLAVTKEDSRALYDLAYYHWKTGDSESALQFVRQAADKGYAPAQNRLANYCRGHQFRMGPDSELDKSVQSPSRIRIQTKNTVLAFDYYGKSAAQKNMIAIKKLLGFGQSVFTYPCVSATAFFEIGQYLYNIKDYPKAIKYLEESAQRGSVAAQMMLGEGYFNNKFGVSDPFKGIKYALMANDDGNNNAAFYLFHDCYVPNEDNKELINSIDADALLGYIESQADAGHPGAQHHLGFCFERGLLGLEKNMDQAIKYFELAAGQKHGHALYKLATCYISGDGVKRDFNHAQALLKSAADQGHSCSQSCLGQIYDDFAEIEEAVRYFEMAAAQGDPHAIKGLLGCTSYYYDESTDESRTYDAPALFKLLESVWFLFNDSKIFPKVIRQLLESNQINPSILIALHKILMLGYTSSPMRLSLIEVLKQFIPDFALAAPNDAIQHQGNRHQFFAQPPVLTNPSNILSQDEINEIPRTPSPTGGTHGIE